LRFTPTTPATLGHGEDEWAQQAIFFSWQMYVSTLFYFNYSFRKAKKAPRKLPACFQQGMGESGLPHMKFNGKVYYCSQRDDCNFICNDLRYKNCD
jgi:hypothetical protein